MKAVVKTTLLLVILAIVLDVTKSQGMGGQGMGGQGMGMGGQGMFNNPMMLWSLFSGNDWMRRMTMMNMMLGGQGMGGGGGMMNPLLMMGLLS
ncbi:glycine and methionine-rich protein-like [Littorina saxatilis]|uniref:glycine and methionine-rich protein-like n=1 Tax=Littorina saxatilis TaxID=31220 RepID=UPI0038B476AD